MLKRVTQLSTTVLTLLSILLGVAFGLIAQMFDPTEESVTVIAFPGKIFINSLKCIVLVFVIVIMMRTPMDMTEIGDTKQFAVLAIGYYLLTSLVAAFIGLLTVNLVKPGTRNYTNCQVGVTSENRFSDIRAPTVVESLLAVFDMALPPNVFVAIQKDNILGILTIFLTIGFFLARYSHIESGKQLKKLLDLIYQAVIDILQMIIRLSPLGIFSLISGEVLKINDVCVLIKMSEYMGTFIVTNLIMIFMVYPTIYVTIVRKNPFSYIKHFTRAILTALSTSSSAAALPLNLQAAYDTGSDPNICNFVLPLGATLNMNGSSIYYPTTIVFISFFINQPIDIPTMIILCFVSALVTVGSAPIPSGTFVYLFLVSNSIGFQIPSQAISLILAIDPLMDRIITMTNVCGDSYSVAVVEKLNRMIVRRKKVKEVQESPPLTTVERVQRRLSQSLQSIKNKEIK